MQAKGEGIRLPVDKQPVIWAVMEENDSPEKRAFCLENRINYIIMAEDSLSELPPPQPLMFDGDSGKKKVVVTGCFDWLHSGHVRFFEETAELGDLFVVLGHDDNVRLLKANGRTCTVPNSRLCEADAAYVDSIRSQLDEARIALLSSK